MTDIMVFFSGEGVEEVAYIYMLGLRGRIDRWAQLRAHCAFCVELCQIIGRLGNALEKYQGLHNDAYGE